MRIINDCDDAWVREKSIHNLWIVRLCKRTYTIYEYIYIYIHSVMLSYGGAFHFTQPNAHNAIVRSARARRWNRGRHEHARVCTHMLKYRVRKIKWTRNEINMVRDRAQCEKHLREKLWVYIWVWIAYSFNDAFRSSYEFESHEIFCCILCGASVWSEWAN